MWHLFEYPCTHQESTIGSNSNNSHLCSKRDGSSVILPSNFHVFLIMKDVSDTNRTLKLCTVCQSLLEKPVVQQEARNDESVRYPVVSLRPWNPRTMASGGNQLHRLVA